MNILLILPGFILAIFIVVMYEIKLRKQENKVKLQNKVHFYVARDKDEELWLYLGKPIREKGGEVFVAKKYNCGISYSCRLNQLKLNIDEYKYLKWEDEPVEVFINMED